LLPVLFCHIPKLPAWVIHSLGEGFVAILVTTLLHISWQSIKQVVNRRLPAIEEGATEARRSHCLSERVSARSIIFGTIVWFN